MLSEFYFTKGGEQYTVFPAGWEDNGCDVFEIALSDTGEFVDSILVSPLESVEEAFERWAPKENLVVSLSEIIASLAHWECDCVPELGPSHCHACSDKVGYPVPWSEAHPQA